MSKNKLRVDKTCLNCKYVVESKFCPNCGQENTETRKTFHHLFVHFFEDLTHYENSFWKTIRNLLFKPAALTLEYLSGKRLSYLAPIRLYIFISFVTFFLLAVIPQNDKDALVQIKESSESDSKAKSFNGKQIDSLKQSKKDSIELANGIAEIEELRKKGIIENNAADSIIKHLKDDLNNVEKKDKRFFSNSYKSISQMDSIRKISPDSINDIEYWFSKKIINTNNKYTNKEIIEKMKESMTHNFPKTLFVYMPLFALVLWLFHNKKRWYYFDHGIFTLHYFSFLLLISLILGVCNRFFGLFDNNLVDVLKLIVNLVGFGWMFYYFFPAHHRFYKETRVFSFFKSMALLFINSFLALIVLLFFVLYSLVAIN